MILISTSSVQIGVKMHQFRLQIFQEGKPTLESELKMSQLENYWTARFLPAFPCGVVQALPLAAEVPDGVRVRN